MTLTEALDFIHCTDWKGSQLGLDRMAELMRRLGDPQRDLRFIHIAGTNGKGSTAALLSSILTAAGYRTGLYTSPHLVRVNERMVIDGAEITDDELCQTAERVKKATDALTDAPTEFEILTAMAFCWFAEKKCGAVVLEVGLGGRLDATNIIPPPAAAVITNIGLEHTEILGDTLEKIAREKAGIIKPGCPAVAYSGTPETERVYESVCAEKGAELRLARFDALRVTKTGLDGQKLSWLGYRDLALPLLGEHQAKNAVVALETVQALNGRGWEIGEGAVRAGLAAARWPGRFEILWREPLFINDGAHNPQCVETLARSLETLLPGQKVQFLMGVLADKDYSRMLDTLLPFAQGFVCLTPDSPRAMAAETLAALLGEKGQRAVACDSAAQGIAAALTEAQGAPVVVCGSLYMLGAVREAFSPALRKFLRRGKIKARDALSPAERETWSKAISERILALPAFQKAKTVMLYRAVKGEVSLAALESAAQAQGKRLVYPLCVSGTEMLALCPRDASSWQSGYCGIPEPVRERSAEVAPEEIDLMLCPCTAFDGDCGRLGMGGGFYDRFLPKCVNAAAVAVAFEAQRLPRVPMEPWDRPVDAVVTEAEVISAAEE